MFFPKNVDDRDSTLQFYHFQIIALVTIKKNKVYRRSLKAIQKRLRDNLIINNIGRISR